LSVLGTKIFASDKSIKTAGELNDFLRSLYTVIEPSVDRIIIGNPETIITKVGTCWMPFMQTLKEAKKQGINTLIVHEPTFYTHWDLDGIDELTQGMSKLAKDEYEESIKKKKKWIEDNNMVIIRSHDVMDIVKDFGMPFALGQAIGFTNADIVRSKNYFNVYAIEKDKAINVAKRISDALKSLGQPGVKFYGNENRMVSTVGVGTGYICDPILSKDLNPDLSVAIDDTMRAWIQPYLAADTGNPLVVINHGTSEDSGMRLLSEFLNKNVKNIEFTHFEQGCAYKWI
ncbi:MAG: Nif3-like dinuclear metal center hexameric protein, partial [Bacteroidota bacterium]